MNKQKQGKPVLEVVNGQINRAWDAIPDGFTGLLYTTPPLKQELGEPVAWKFYLDGCNQVVLDEDNNFGSYGCQ